jgi:hypothetical protein
LVVYDYTLFSFISRGSDRNLGQISLLLAFARQACVLSRVVRGAAGESRQVVNLYSGVRGPADEERRRCEAMVGAGVR